MHDDIWQMYVNKRCGLYDERVGRVGICFARVASHDGLLLGDTPALDAHGTVRFLMESLPGLHGARLPLSVNGWSQISICLRGGRNEMR